MCGIVGVAGKINKQGDDIFYDLLQMNVVRGPHSTGMAYVNSSPGSKAQIIKKAMSPPDFLSLIPVSNAFKGSNNVYIGHNRWATSGKINNTNAHPFEVGDIVGVHNGTLLYQDRLVDWLDYAVDSENIIHSINKVGVDETWRNVDGAAALVWYNNVDGTLNFLRNKERELHFCYSKDLAMMFYSSEALILAAALARNNIKHHKIELLPVNRLYTFKVDRFTKDSKEIVKCEHRHVEPCVPFRRNYGRGYYGNSYYSEETYSSSSTKQVGTTVDFCVEKVISKGNKRKTYHVRCNQTDAKHIIEDIDDVVKLAVGDCRTGSVVYAVGKETFIAASTVKDNSNYELVTEQEDKMDNVVSIEIEDSYKEVVLDDYQDFEDAIDEEENLLAYSKLLDTTCSWCSSPVQPEEDWVEDGQGGCFCQDCVDLPDVKPYLVHGVAL